VFVDANEDRFERHDVPLSDLSKGLLDNVARLSLAQRPRFALFGLIALAKLEFGDRHRAIVAIAFYFGSSDFRGGQFIAGLIPALP
jgi:hypothetical protein